MNLNDRRGKGNYIRKFSLPGLLIVLICITLFGHAILKAQNSGPITGSASGNLTPVYSTYVGGTNADTIRDVAIDSNGNSYITGGTASADLVTSQGAYDTTHNGSMDVFVMKFDPNGNLIWSTFIGSTNYDRAYAIEVDSQGYVYVAGRAGDGYPTTSGVLQPNFGGDVNISPAYGAQDGFVTKLSPDGSQIVWSTYFGGNGRGYIRDFDIDSAGQVHLALTAVSTANPHITPGAFQTNLSGGYDGVVAKISSDGSQVLWATYVGGSGQWDLQTPSVRVGQTGDVYVLGGTQSTDIPTSTNAYDQSLGGNADLHVVKFSPTGTFLFGTYLGGSAAEWGETHELALDSQGNAIVAATTLSTDFPTTSGVVQPTYGGSGGSGTGQGTNYPGDAFVAKISSDGTQLLASTFIGGLYGEGAEGVGIDAQNNVYFSGATYSDNFLVTTDAFQGSKSGNADFFAVKLSANLSQRLYASYLGGSDIDYGRASMVDPNGNFLIAGATISTDWPTLNPWQANIAGGSDGTLVKFASNVTAPANQPPYIPNSPIPADGASNVFTSQGLSWQGGDPDGDVVAYTVAFGPVSPPPTVGTSTLTNYSPLMSTGDTYYWQITATDGLSTSVGPIWSFTTTDIEFLSYLPVILKR